MKITLSRLFAILTICAILVAARDLFAEAIPAGLWLALLIGIEAAVIFAFFAARGIVARLVARRAYRRNMLWVSRFLAGNTFTALELNRFGVTLLNAGENAEALRAFNVVLKCDRRPAVYWLNRGIAAYALGQLNAAVSDFSRAIRRDPKVPNGHLWRGRAQFFRSEFLEAVEDLSRHLAEHPADALAISIRGAAHEALSEWERAYRDYQQACNVDPSLMQAAQALTRLQASCPENTIRNGANAVANAHRICVLTEWKEWTAISLLAAAYAESGDFDAALLFAEKAHELAPSEEKAIRLGRIRDYENGIPFRLPDRRAEQWPVES